MMTLEQLEERLSALEREVHDMKRRPQTTVKTGADWLDELARLPKRDPETADEIDEIVRELRASDDPG
jgi:hypothetical protein